jgi:hypothetical protein
MEGLLYFIIQYIHHYNFLYLLRTFIHNFVLLFHFQFDIVELLYPLLQPNIKCITPIYHPNIDTLETDENDLISNVCVSILDDWTPVNGLDDCVQALLFLFHQPNTSDSLRVVDGDIQENQFLENVKISLEGGTVENCNFQPNYGWVENCSAVKYNKSGPSNK